MNTIMRNIVVSVLVIALVLVGVYVFQNKKPTKNSSTRNEQIQKILVTASFYPYAYLVQEVGKDLVEVVSLTPPGVEAHDFEPTAKDITQIEKSSLFVLNGGGVEEYEENIRQVYEGKELRIVALGENYMKGRDPHVWLDPVIMGKMSVDLANILSTVNPEYSTKFMEYATEFQNKMAALDSELQKSLVSCKKDTIFTAHTAFGYLADRYGFKQVGIAGIHPEEEPSAQELGEIAKEIQKVGARYVLLEEMAPTKFSEILAEETGATLLVLSPIESIVQEELKEGESYFTKQQSNIRTLKTALECL